MPDLKFLGGVKVDKVPDWITFTPDSKKLYVANAHDNTVSVIDVAARKEITKIKVGQVPKRNITAILPSLPTTNSSREETMDYTALFCRRAAVVRRSLRPLARRSVGAATATRLPRRRRWTTRCSRRSVQPILTAPRKGNARCIACHSRGGGNAYLEPLAAGSHDLYRGAVAPEFRTRVAARRARRAAEERPADQPAGRRSGRQPLARRREALAVAGQSGMADARVVGPDAPSRCRFIDRGCVRSGETALNFDVFKTKVQPILTSAPQRQRTLHRLPFTGRWQRVPGTAAARRHDLYRRTVAAKL